LGLFLSELEGSGSPLKVAGLKIEASLKNPYTHRFKLLLVSLVLKNQD